MCERVEGENATKATRRGSLPEWFASLKKENCNNQKLAEGRRLRRQRGSLMAGSRRDSNVTSRSDGQK